MEKIQEQMERRLQAIHQWDNEIRIPIPPDFKVLRAGHEIAEGFYLTLRLRTGCMYQMINEFRNGKWNLQTRDDSEIVAYKEVPDQLYQILEELEALDAERKKLETPAPTSGESQGENENNKPENEEKK